MVDMPCFVGIDVAKAQLDIALRPSGERWAVPNEASGVTTLVDRVQALHPTLIVLEATGGLERAVASALALAGLPVVVVNPRQVRDCARATGQLAKTDALDARALAHFADVIRPTPRPLPDAQTQELRALLGRRQQLIVMRTAEQNRFELTDAQHAALLAILTTLPCMVMLSGYWMVLYAEALDGWTTLTYQAMTRGGRLATASLWMNYPPPLSLNNYRFPGENFCVRERLKRQQQRWVARLQTMPHLERQALLTAIAEAFPPAPGALAADGER